MRKRSYRSGKFSNTHRFRSFFESCLLSLDLVIKQRKLQPERGGFGVNTVRSSDNDCGLELLRALLQYGQQALNVLENDRRCVPHLQRHRGIQDVGRSKPKMEEP